MSEQPPTRFSGKLIIGLTGNIATGKSAVMKLAAEHGALTIDADEVVHELMANDAKMQAAIAVAFGSEVRKEDGRIDRKKLGNIVFDDPQAMQDLEGIVHPAVRRTIAHRIAESENKLVVIEAIKLLEGTLVTICHQIWVTRCSQKRQLERLRVCRGMDTETAVARIKAQSAQEEKVAQADVVIDTSGLMTDTEKQFLMAWDRLPDPASVATKLLPELPPEPTAPKPARQTKSEPPSAAVETPPPTTPKPTDRPDNLDVRRARPSDVASMLLLIQKATDGAVEMKRAELLMALSERGYFIGQTGTEVSAVVGWNIDSQVARVDQTFIYPLEATATTGLAILEEIEKSANAHVCEIIIAFVMENTAEELLQMFAWQGFETKALTSLPPTWQQAITESQPEDTQFLIKVLRDRRLKRN